MKDSDSGVLHVKQFPSDLAQALRVRAAEEGMTRRGLVIKILREYLKSSKPSE